ERDAHLPAAAELAAQLRLVVRREAQTIEHAPDPPLDAITVERFEGLEQAPLLFDERIEIAVAAPDAMRDLLKLQLEAARFGERCPELRDQLALRLVAGLLSQVAQRAAAMPAGALVRPIFAGEQAEDRRL